MPNFRVSLTPGVLTDTNNPINIRFTSPRNAQAVVIRLLEMDSWDSLGNTLSEAARVGSDVIAEFTGSIQNYRFTPEDSRTEQAEEGSLTLKIQFHGQDQAVDVPVLNAGFEAEGAELEIGLEVTGEIGGHDREYTTPGPVFVRHPNLSGEENRPIITFITANDTFHRAARNYWRPRADGLRNTNNLRQILAYLSDVDHLPGGLKWGQINIVSHGTEWEWSIRAHPSSPAGQQLRHADVAALQSHDDIVIPGEDVIDSNTVLVLRGCHLGNNQELMDEVRTLFGGRCKVLAPRYYQFYEWRGNRQRELFREGLYYWQTGNSMPGQAEIYERLRAEYGENEISNEDLHALVADISERHVSNQQIEFEYTYLGGEPPASHDVRMGDLRGVWEITEDNQYTDVDDWEWTSQIASHGEEESLVVFRGRRRKIEYRRILMDANGNAVVPDLNNGGHYGQSPLT